MTVGFHTFGCKLNQCETESLAEAFRSEGFDTVDAGRPADLYLVNTCTVTSKSEQKARRFLKALCLAAPGAPILVTGCYAELEAGELGRLAPQIRIVPLRSEAGLADLAGRLGAASAPGGLPELIDSWLAGLDARRPAGAGFRLQPLKPAFHSRAYLKIQDGCDCHCTYCRVRIARGPSRSLPLEEALARAGDIEGQGYREVVLTGVNIGSYRDGRTGLAELLERLLSSSPGLRFRLSSLEPDGVDPALAGVAAHERVCPHFHIPVQSGSAKVLAAMGRRPSPEAILRAVELLRAAKDDPYLAADFITGFPGESEADFEDSQGLAGRAEFTDLHVFQFSPRPGTPAADFSGRVAQRISGERARRLRELAGRRLAEYRLRQIGRWREVLIESLSADGARGTSENYLDVFIRAPASASIKKGGLYRVQILAVEKDTLVGEII